jgi:acyl-[acyl-carrier-protein] desaturase
VSFQELATRVSHRNTGKLRRHLCEQMTAARGRRREPAHDLLPELLAAALEIAPNEAMRAITMWSRAFQMPGYTIDGFLRKSVAIANRGIYDLRLHHDEVLMPVLRKWKVFELEGLDAEGEKAREELADFMGGLEVAAKKFEERREARRARQKLRA